MAKPPAYKSSIPAGARKRATARYPNGVMEEAEYHLRGEIIGKRGFFESGDPEFEFAYQGGEKHGMQYWWHGLGMLQSAEQYVDGLPHGTFTQWDYRGKRIGTFRMVRGTGLDLWRQQREDETTYLAEVLYLKNGQRKGFEWWIEEDQAGVFIERHWRDSCLHGIERQWNAEGRLRRGYPKYHVAAKVVTKRQYLKAALIDPTLPPFRPKDNKPARKFPPEVARHLHP